MLPAPASLTPPRILKPLTAPMMRTQFVEAFNRAEHGVEPTVTQPKGLNLW